MGLAKLRIYFFFFLLGFFFIPPSSSRLWAQSFSTQNLTEVKSEDWSNKHLRGLLNHYKNKGGDLSSLDEYLLGRGMAAEEVSKVMARVEELEKGKTPSDKVAATDVGNEVVTSDRGEQDRPAPEGKALRLNGLPIYGTSFFNNPKVSFTPNQNMPASPNYILGPGDELSINVYGYSVVNWDLKVQSDGSLLLPGMKKVYVGGKTLDNATTLIKNTLRTHHYAIGSGTEVSVNLANIRSIRVSINGEVQHPGNYTLSSMSTVFNALYESGGVNINGSLRSIKLIRNGALFARVDVYDFLLRGDNSGDYQLQEGDIIQVPVYNTRVSISGKIKRPAYYEMMPGESLRDLIDFAGGFMSEAYTKRIKAIRLTDVQKRMEDIDQANYESFTPVNGDQFLVDETLDRFENRISINGAVYRPGDFELKQGYTLAQLIEDAGGLKEDAFSGRGYIVRINPDNTTQVISFNIHDLAARKKGTDINLQREDIITIPSIFNLRDNYTVSIQGAVRKPGMVAFSEGLTVKDLIITSGGFARGADPSKVVIARRFFDPSLQDTGTQLVNITEIKVDSNLHAGGEDFILQPYDIVSVYFAAGYAPLGSVEIGGEVLFPGHYVIKYKNERLSDLIERAGGLTSSAYAEGATLKRISINSVAQRLQESYQRKVIEKDDSNFQTDVTEEQNALSSYVGIRLKEILNKPGSKTDVVVNDGDVLHIPRKKDIVRTNGAIYAPASIVFDKSRLKYYISQSGGFTTEALKRKSFVVYANGTQQGTKHFLFFKNYPKVLPGSEIFVPEKVKKERQSISAQAWVGIGTSTASMAAIIYALIQNINSSGH